VTERELARGATRRLAIIGPVQEVTGNVALTCPYYGVTWQCYYLSFRRYEKFGVEGLRDRSSRRHVSPQNPPRGVRRQGIYCARTTTPGRTRSRRISSGTTRSRSPVRHLAKPQAPRHEPSAGVTALQAPHGALEVPSTGIGSRST
jgi:hypothetical protein